LIITFQLFCSSPVRAVQEFSTDYQSIYTISGDGTTNVIHTITINNNLANIFPKEYTLSVGTTNLTNILAIDANNISLPVTSTINTNQNNIHVSLNNPNIGYNQKNTIKISYSTTEVVIHNGQVWEINIPRLKQGGEMANVERIVQFPETLGSPTASYPSPDETKTDQGQTQVTYRGNRQEAISLLFGKGQWYQVDLDYELTPPLSKNSLTEISLPPDTPYQQVILASINPAPSIVVADVDGNWLARYPYNENFTTQVHAQLFVQVSPIPLFPDPSSVDLPEYLTGNQYWNIDNSLVKDTAARLKTSKNIYDYLVSTFIYNSSRITPGADRLGASSAIESPSQALCTEFTDTFVALSRSSRIPSREINGYALSNNTKLRPLDLETDVLHAWPEYYNATTKVWTQVDPTWGNTTGGLDYFNKLDYNHIAFVRRGLEPTYPYPAGVYKKSVNQKTIKVKIADAVTPSTKNYTVTQEQNTYRIRNTGNSALIKQAIKLPDGSDYTVTYLPPYGEQTTQSTLGAKSTNTLNLIIIIATIASLGLIIAITAYLTKRHKRKNIN